MPHIKQLPTIDVFKAEAKKTYPKYPRGKGLDALAREKYGFADYNTIRATIKRQEEQAKKEAENQALLIKRMVFATREEMIFTAAEAAVLDLLLSKVKMRPGEETYSLSIEEIQQFQFGDRRFDAVSLHAVFTSLDKSKAVLTAPPYPFKTFHFDDSIGVVKAALTERAARGIANSSKYFVTTDRLQ